MTTNTECCNTEDFNTEDFDIEAYYKEETKHRACFQVRKIVKECLLSPENYPHDLRIPLLADTISYAKTNNCNRTEIKKLKEMLELFKNFGEGSKQKIREMYPELAEEIEGEEEEEEDSISYIGTLKKNSVEKEMNEEIASVITEIDILSKEGVMLNKIGSRIHHERNFNIPEKVALQTLAMWSLKKLECDKKTLEAKKKFWDVFSKSMRNDIKNLDELDNEEETTNEDVIYMDRRQLFEDLIILKFKDIAAGEHPKDKYRLVEEEFPDVRKPKVKEEESQPTKKSKIEEDH